MGGELLFRIAVIVVGMLPVVLLGFLLFKM
jgi:hypothetical protein